MAEWRNIYNLFDDMCRYARAHPHAKFFCADNPTTKSYGWLAKDVDEAIWTIRIERFLKTYRDGLDHPEQLRTGKARQQHLAMLVLKARAIKTLWERLDDD